MRISSGTARKNSITAVTGTRTHAWSDRRPTASRAPSRVAATMATAAT